MITTISGDNDFLIRQEINASINNFKKLNDPIGLEIIDDFSGSCEELKQQILSYSLLSPNKMIILIEPSKVKDFSNDIKEIIQSLPKTTDLIIVEHTLDKRQLYYKELKSSTEFKLLTKLDQPAIIRFVIKSTNECGGIISNRDAAYLVERVGDDQMLLSHEIEKLTLYSPEISTSSIDLLTERSVSSTIFQLLDAAFNGRPKQALDIYYEQRALKIDPEQILAMLSWQLQTLALVMSAKNESIDQVAANARISPFVARKAKQVAAKLSFTTIKKMVNELSNIDYRSKRQSFDLDEAIKTFIIGV
jgi:DNA polymerase-3 subunit delta